MSFHAEARSFSLLVREEDGTFANCARSAANDGFRRRDHVHYSGKESLELHIAGGSFIAFLAF